MAGMRKEPPVADDFANVPKRKVVAVDSTSRLD
jgi:hypothetical protein